MKVVPRRYTVCTYCTTWSPETEFVKTNQWLTEVSVPRSRSCWSRDKTQLGYKCSECGEINC